MSLFCHCEESRCNRDDEAISIFDNLFSLSFWRRPESTKNFNLLLDSYVDSSPRIVVRGKLRWNDGIVISGMARNDDVGQVFKVCG